MQWIAGVAQAFSLGTPIGSAAQLHGGRAHSVWRLETSNGIYVAKALNTFHTADAERLGLIRDKVRLELAARQQGVRMPPLVASRSGDMLVHLPGPAGGCAIEARCHPMTMNYQTLGNGSPHLHTHVTARYRDDIAPGAPLPVGPNVARPEAEWLADITELRALLV